MNAITLFDIAQDVRESVNRFDPETGEINEAYSENRELFESKAVACVAYAKEEAAALDAAQSLLEQMGDKLKARAQRLERFKAYMADCMKYAGITEVKHDLGLFEAKLYLNRDESVELEEGATFPPELCNDPKPPAPSKAKIKAAIKAGEAVAGARLVKKDRLALK